MVASVQHWQRISVSSGTKTKVCNARTTIKKCPALGAKAYEQCAGSCALKDGSKPLDASAVHPAYGLVESMAAKLGTTVQSLIGNEAFIKQIDTKQFCNRTVLASLR